MESKNAFDPLFEKKQAVEQAATVWQTLSAINVNNHVEKKNGFSYLSWAWAWGVLMDKFPSARFSFLTVNEDGHDEVFRFPDGTCELRCILTVEGISRSMWLPVMDHRNNAIKNPNARDINDTKMRCLVKAMALFGLGHYIYAGEDLPDASKATKPEEAKPEPMNIEQAKAIFDAVSELTTAINTAESLDALKTAYTKAVKYANNRTDKNLVKSFTELKDVRKTVLAK